MNTWSRHWWLIVARGSVALIVGLAALFVPVISVTTLISVLSAFLIVDGLVLIGAGWSQGTASNHWWALVLQGIIGIVAGTLGLVSPTMTALAFTIIAGVWAVVGGVFEIAYAIRMRRELSNEWLLGVGGLVSTSIGVLLLAYPSTSLIVLAVALGAYTVISGAILLSLGVRMRGQAQRERELAWHVHDIHGPHSSPA
jgi:uncharacterized membrane protein HdeD (DUF308 family)